MGAPPAFKNRHATDWHRDIAEGNTILRTQVGSGLHGVTIEGTDDRDEMGICIEPPDCVIGLRQFEQYLYRTQPEGVRSGAGDLDLVIYSLRKWARLAAAGNPTVLLLLFVPDQEIVTIDDKFGPEIRNAPELFLSRDCGRRFTGYLDAQRDQMLGLRSKHTNRPELIDIYGFDTKFAYHAVRLGLQGVELLTTGRITLPIPEPSRSWLYDLRIGKVSKDAVLDAIDVTRYELVRCTASCDLPEQCDYDRLNRWLVGTYSEWWDDQGLRE